MEAYLKHVVIDKSLWRYGTLQLPNGIGNLFSHHLSQGAVKLVTTVLVARCSDGPDERKEEGTLKMQRTSIPSTLLAVIHYTKQYNYLFVFFNCINTKKQIVMQLLHGKAPAEGHNTNCYMEKHQQRDTALIATWKSTSRGTQH